MADDTRDDEREVRRLDDTWNQVYAENRRELFEDILADDFEVVLHDGRRGGKAQMLDPTERRRVTFSERDLQLFGATAITRGRVLIEHPEGPVDQRFFRVYCRRDGRWQAVTASAYPVCDHE